ncbi:Pre-mRNA-splicing factor brr2 [Leucoagaricus sp. SymC.cos]|nr:Pre-mRNA-splicing factor brr2 [Leucoagaricus sp. SymC.cos]
MLYPITFGTDESILLCASTGAGKTIIAMLAIINELAKWQNEATGGFDIDKFKVVYIAPIKALVQEMVGNFQARPKAFGIQVSELTGRSQMTKQQIAETQIVVTTPEKWDVIARKSTGTSYTNLAMNKVCYEKVLDQAGENQNLVFVHSRRETAETAKFLCDMAVEKGTITQFIKPKGVMQEILTEESKNCEDGNLCGLLFGFTIYPPGMSHEDHTLVEDLFTEGHVQVPVCTATFAWGVNLPVHTVIIEGTQIYNPRKGMSGYHESSRVAALFEFVKSAVADRESVCVGVGDNLDAEIVLGTIRNRDEAVQWLGYTYLYVRMLKDPGLYDVSIDYQDESDPGLIQKRANIICSATVLLTENSSRQIRAQFGSMMGYNKHLKPTMSSLELFRVFALSDEFKLIPVRQEEKIELSKLLERVPIPIEESVEEPAADMHVSLQAYISQQLKLDGILRAMFRMGLKHGWAIPAKAASDLCKMVEKRMWGSMTPLRQLKGVPAEFTRKAEEKQFPWYRHFDLTSPEIEEFDWDSECW